MIYPPERHPPYAPESEISVLGAMLIDNNAVPKVIEMLDESMFYREPHRRIFRAMLRMFQRGMVIDPASLADALRDSGELDEVGGLGYVAEILDAVPTAANVEYYCQTVRDRATRRRLIDVCGDAIRQAHQPGDIDTDEMLESVQSRLFEVGSSATDGNLEWIKKSLYATFERIEELQASGGGITGVPTGLADLDEMTGGFQKSDLIIVAARPSMGKTALVTGIMLHAAITAKVPVAMFSLEMSRQQLNQRMLCYEGMVDLGRLLKGRLTDDDYVRLTQAAGHLNTAPIFVDDRGGVGVNYIRARARRAKSEQPDLGLIIVDYIQLCNGTGENENVRVGSVSKGLKNLAKELDVPVVALSQLSRAPTQRADHRPQLSDLRDSGSIEQDADVVMFLHRPEYYLSPKKAQEDGVQGKAELIIGKQRNGPTGDVDLFFRKESARFESSTKWGA